MIYELSLVTKADLVEQDIQAMKKIVHDVVKDHEGGVLIEDDWGKLNLAQMARSGDKSAHFLYFIFEANNKNNLELARRFKINENHLRHMVSVLGEESDREAIVKAYKTPFSKTYRGSQTDKKEGEENESENPRKFARRRSCWFRANGIKADWKDPATFSWLVNEFGKISPARISGISTKYQRLATTAIKQARQLGIISHVSNQVAENR